LGLGAGGGAHLADVGQVEKAFAVDGVGARDLLDFLNWHTADAKFYSIAGAENCVLGMDGRKAQRNG
jgi:hypothetical protein